MHVVRMELQKKDVISERKIVTFIDIMGKELCNLK
jgi:hypothetical protein